MLISFSLSAQKSSITLTFSGVNSNNQNVVLDSVLVENVTQALDVTLVYPDLSITLEYEAGIDDNINEGFKGSLIYPNPFNDFSLVSINNSKNQNVIVSIVDNFGRLICENTRYLSKGEHNYKFFAGYAGTYHIIISNGNTRSVIKAVSLKQNNSTKQKRE